MKIIRLLIILIVLFLLTILALSTFNSPSDGNDSFGFPFTFYTYLGGKRSPEPLTRHDLNISMLVLDILILATVSFILENLLFRSKNKSGA
ncbi:hypothetical protein C3K47_19280 [Solitalea longa]|uniref:Uncharacterized protein n=1 Tax=Solitalea longa TaxID=2079460 RepID=A0A2S4ZXJ6_9SPHI|nr:hypothetical protein C3K47_19280 [Solitalea longa]